MTSDPHRLNRECDCYPPQTDHPPAKHFVCGCLIKHGHVCGYEPVHCGDCDGTGWLEGSPAFSCKHCDGTGWEPMAVLQQENEVMKMTVTLPMTAEMAEDAPYMREGMAVLFAVMKRPMPRYRNIYMDGY